MVERANDFEYGYIVVWGDLTSLVFKIWYYGQIIK